MGIYGFVCSAGGSIGVLLGGFLTTALNWHWIFLVNVPIGALVYFACLRAAAASTRHARSGTKLDVAGAITVTTSLMLAVYAIVNGHRGRLDVRTQTVGTLGGRGGAARGFPDHRIAREGAADAARPVQAAQCRHGQHCRVCSGPRRCSPGSSSRRSICSWCWATTPCRWGCRSCPRISSWRRSRSGLSAKIVMKFGWRKPLALGLLCAAAGPGAVRARTARRKFLDRRIAGHDAARHRRRHRVQPAVVRCDERCEPAPIRASPPASSTRPS